MKFDIDYLAKLRSAGVKSVTLRPYIEDAEGGFMPMHVEFFPPSPARESGAIVPKSMTQDAPHQEDMCACGHSIPSHDQAGNCYLGCELPKCMASVAK